MAEILFGWWVAHCQFLRWRAEWCWISGRSQDKQSVNVWSLLKVSEYENMLHLMWIVRALWGHQLSFREIAFFFVTDRNQHSGNWVGSKLRLIRAFACRSTFDRDLVTSGQEWFRTAFRIERMHSQRQGECAGSWLVRPLAAFAPPRLLPWSPPQFRPDLSSLIWLLGTHTCLITRPSR